MIYRLRKWDIFFFLFIDYGNGILIFFSFYRLRMVMKDNSLWDSYRDRVMRCACRTLYEHCLEENEAYLLFHRCAASLPPYFAGCDL